MSSVVWSKQNKKTNQPQNQSNKTNKQLHVHEKSRQLHRICCLLYYALITRFFPRNTPTTTYLHLCLISLLFQEDYSMTLSLLCFDYDIITNIIMPPWYWYRTQKANNVSCQLAPLLKHSTFCYPNGDKEQNHKLHQHSHTSAKPGLRPSLWSAKLQPAKWDA